MIYCTHNKIIFKKFTKKVLLKLFLTLKKICLSVYKFLFLLIIRMNLSFVFSFYQKNCTDKNIINDKHFTTRENK